MIPIENVNQFGANERCLTNIKRFLESLESYLYSQHYDISCYKAVLRSDLSIELVFLDDRNFSHSPEVRTQLRYIVSYNIYGDYTQYHSMIPYIVNQISEQYSRTQYIPNMPSSYQYQRFERKESINKKLLLL